MSAKYKVQRAESGEDSVFSVHAFRIQDWGFFLGFVDPGFYVLDERPGPGAGYWQPPQGGFGIVAATSVAGGLNGLELPPTSWRFPDDPAIEAVRVTAQEVFASTQVTWADAAGQPVAGFRPAAIYPPLFARDLSWIVPAARLFYPPRAWQPGVEAFLRRQYTATTRSDEDGWQAGAGALPGVLHSDGRVDKASAVSDEETSLIGAAYSLFEVQGAAWLTTVMTGTAGQANGSQATGSRCYECEVHLRGLQAEQGAGSRSHDSQDAAGLAAPRVIDRLDAALTWLWDNRREAASGLIWRGHTTDWGDVTLDVTAPNPTDLDPARALRTASIFDQVLAWRAARQLATMWEALGEAARAAAWRQAAGADRKRPPIGTCGSRGAASTACTFTGQGRPARTERRARPGSIRSTRIACWRSATRWRCRSAFAVRPRRGRFWTR